MQIGDKVIIFQKALGHRMQHGTVVTVSEHFAAVVYKHDNQVYWKPRRGDLLTYKGRVVGKTLA